MKARHFLFDHQYFHEITIDRDPEAVFDYVTDPSRWHEWFSASQPARINLDPQKVDESFELATTFRMLPGLPFHITQDLKCRVSKCDRPYLWEVEAESQLLRAITSYTLSRNNGGTVLKRNFCYAFNHRYRVLEPVLFRRRIAAQAELSLQRLKGRLEHNY